MQQSCDNCEHGPIFWNTKKSRIRDFMSDVKITMYEGECHCSIPECLSDGEQMVMWLGENTGSGCEAWKETHVARILTKCRNCGQKRVSSEFKDDPEKLISHFCNDDCLYGYLNKSKQEA